jgi:hypothetical protein
MPMAVGSMLGFRYALERQIGAGGYSEVWRAHDGVLDRPVAVKLLHSGHAQQAEFLARFRTEAQLASRLAHVNVARVYDFCDLHPDEQPYLVMELVDGPSLAQVLQRGRLEPAVCMDILAQAASGLQAAHAAGLVHRDVKPANIMLAPGVVVKITDFGLSHTLASAPITGTGLLLGTPGYLAPERAAGARATPAADLYALGVVGYECLSGSAPFTGQPLEVALAHREQAFPPLPAATPSAVTELISQLTAKDPAARPASAGIVAQRAAELHDRLARTRRTADPDWPPAAGRGGTPAAPFAPPVRPPAVQNQPTLVTGLPTAAPPPAAAVSRRRAGLAAAALVAVAAAAIVAVALNGAGSGSGPSSAATSPTSTPTVRAVDVRRAALIGEPAWLAVRQLRAEGFRVRMRRLPTRLELPGRVVSVGPAGLRPPGSLVTVVAATGPGHGHPGGHDHHGQGHNGNGNGNGNGG